MHNAALSLELKHKNEIVLAQKLADDARSKQILAANESEIKYNRTRNELDIQTKRNHDLLANYNRLRGNKNDSSEPGSNSPDSSRETARTELSRDDASFLVEYARLADGTAAYANACYDWVLTLNKLQNENK